MGKREKMERRRKGRGRGLGEREKEEGARGNRRTGRQKFSD